MLRPDDVIYKSAKPKSVEIEFVGPEELEVTPRPDNTEEQGDDREMVFLGPDDVVVSRRTLKWIRSAWYEFARADEHPVVGVLDNLIGDDNG